MTKFFTGAFLSLVFCTTLVRGGDEVRPARKEFRQSSTYPFVFEPVCYLENGGPLPLRFGAPIADCSHRDAPPLPKPPENKAEQPAAGETEPLKTETETTQAKSSPVDVEAQSKASAPAGAYPPQTSTPAALPPDKPDFTKAPEEVMEYYKNPYKAPDPNRHLFDPIFEPAVVHKGPPSKATYREE